MIRRVLLDACVPHRLRAELSMFDVHTARFAGLDQCSDAAMLRAMDGRYDVLVTLDRALPLQQQVAGRALEVVMLSVPMQTPAVFAACVPDLVAAIARIKPGQSVRVAPAGH